MESESKCPFMHGSRDTATAQTNKRWWPERLDLSVLHPNPPQRSPMGPEFDYAAEFQTLDLDALDEDLRTLMTTSQEWWPADYGHYGPLFIRMAWHSAGTYRIADGRGGASTGSQRFAPLNSWPDNANLDKARRLLWPIKQKYGSKISWADLMVLAGTVALESMGMKNVGFAGGREDVWEPENVYWGPEGKWLADERYSGDRDLENPLAAVQMGLIYVNPEGPNGEPDPKAAARDIRETFARMAMNDYETVALVAGGHTFGKSHGAVDPETYVGPEPEAAELHEQGLGWINSYGTGNGTDTFTGGPEGAWTQNPTQWDNGYFDNLFKYEWKKAKSPAGAWQWHPTDASAWVPDAADPSRKHPPMMHTTDLALIEDPAYRQISKHFHEHPQEFHDAFAAAWYKLTHRDMGPRSRYLGPRAVAEELVWQDPVPAVDHSLIDAADIAALERSLRASGLSIGQLVFTAWASASTYRDTDKRGGANVARIRLEPQRSWAANDPDRLASALGALGKVQREFNDAQSGGKRVSLADLIVLGGIAAVKEAARKGGHEVAIRFEPGRTDASDAQTDVESFSVLEPKADGFRNYTSDSSWGSPEEMLIDRASLLALSAPEMTVLVGGMRVLGANHGETGHGVFTARVGTLSNDFFTNLLDVNVTWKPVDDTKMLFEGRNRASGETLWSGTRVDLLFGSNSELRALAEAYASDGAEAMFVQQFADAFGKVMHLDRFDLRPRR